MDPKNQVNNNENENEFQLKNFEIIEKLGAGHY